MNKTRGDMMTEKHKWYDVILAWAEGKDIQWKESDSDKWFDGVWSDETDYIDAPNFNLPNIEWRIKPNKLSGKKLSGKCRVALINQNDSQPYFYVAPAAAFKNYENYSGFICWIGDVIEYDVEIPVDS